MLWILDLRKGEKAENKSHVCNAAIERMRDRIRLKALETAEACYENWGVNSFGAS